MVTDLQREAAKAHGFKFYERQAGRAPSALDLGAAPSLDSFEQVRSTLRHLIEVCHHPDFIAVDLLCSIADREGSPAFKAACYAVREEHNRLGRQAVARALHHLISDIKD
jgi:hypothetical protein